MRALNLALFCAGLLLLGAVISFADAAYCDGGYLQRWGTYLGIAFGSILSWTAALHLVREPDAYPVRPTSKLVHAAPPRRP